jgi:3,4-dihydroxy 2-butanone 4-phosphate synthase/GTP cyclohydrolase II
LLTYPGLFSLSPLGTFKDRFYNHPTTLFSLILPCTESKPIIYLVSENNNKESCEHEAASVERVATANLPTEVGDFKIAGYRSLSSNEEFVALFKGELVPNVPTLVRIHSQCLTGDVFRSTKCDCGLQLELAMAMIEKDGRGAIVYQQQEGRGIGIINKIRAYALQDEGADTVEANEKLGFMVDARNYQQCAEILFDLGLCRVRVMSNNPDKIKALEDAGLKIVERVPLEVETPESAAHYLRVKKEKLGHMLNF